MVAVRGRAGIANAFKKTITVADAGRRERRGRR